MSFVKRKFLYVVYMAFICFYISACQQKTNKTPAPHEEEVVEIAILMPMSGRDSILGLEYDKIIKLGLENGIQGIKINVTSYDGSDEKQVLAALPKIIARKTKIILGPLYSHLADLVAKNVKEHEIIILTMSNNPVLADDKLFVFGHAPLKQLDRMVNYLLDNDEKHFIALLPQGEHAKTIAKIIEDMAVRRNASLVLTKFYTNNPESISESVKATVDNVDKFNEMDDVTKKVAVYLSDDYRNLNMLYDSIKKYHLDKKAMIIGDNRINTDYAKDVDILFTGTLHILNTNIVEQAKDIGVSYISFMHAVAYDLGNMTAHYMDNKFLPDRFINRLNSQLPYTGISGNIYFIDNIAQRGYDIIKRENSIYSTVDLWQHNVVN